ncbi:hypothetical protein [Alkalihalobacillus sp. TS-13]|uniref:hypothetical protein n=1 Tax=Alkalihalobacillus sp. TS-13 TaxID=2842455 RepID=UPI0028936192|nr:hypothetical protein [Alkalihalobacillus sp. TS-13]
MTTMNANNSVFPIKTRDKEYFAVIFPDKSTSDLCSVFWRTDDVWFPPSTSEITCLIR